MSHIETNIYLIENLRDLDCRYRTYRVRGIPETDDYDKNIQALVDTLSRRTKSPCALFSKDQENFIAQPEGYVELPSSIGLIRTNAKIEKLPELYDLNFGSLTRDTAVLASRFLQFSLQNPLYTNPDLWQPQAGYPFYTKFPDPEFKELSKRIDLYRGFTFRVIALPDGKIGICVDTRSKYVDRFPLPTKISRKEFRERYKGLNCLYEYGDTWYEIKLEGYNDLNVSEVEHPKGTSLFDHLRRVAGSGKSQNLRVLPPDCSVLIYYTSLGEPRNVPSGLCRLTYGTNHPEVKPFHPMTIRSPHVRRREIRFNVDGYLRNLTFGSTKIVLSAKSLVADMRTIEVPDLEFGNKKVLSVRGTRDSIDTSLEEFPRRKRDLLYSRDAGLFEKKPLDRQYFIMPKSINESFGEKFIRDVKDEIQRLYPEQTDVYSPIIVPYNDSVQKSVHNIAREIIDTAHKNDVRDGFGIAMIPRLPYKVREEDQLANYLMRKLRQRGVFLSIIHTEVPEESYEYGILEDGNEGWKLVSDWKQRGKYKGYIGNVVLNKILITNNVWPFVLRTPLNADLTIGIDVKNKTVGFTLIYKSVAEIRFVSSQSDQKEQLGRKHMSSKLYQILKEEQELLSKDIEKIAVHRQGMLFPPEKDGIIDTLNRLERENLLTKGYRCTFAEIRTTSRVPFRLFKVTTPAGEQREMVYNPTIGTYLPVSANDAFICTTGYPYRFKGSAKPLHVVKVEGAMSLKEILEDVFYLSNLTWTKVDDCSRLPLSIKMNDIRLREIAGEYDRDVFEFGEEEED